MKFLVYLLITTAFFLNTLQCLAAQEKEIIRVGLSNSAFSTFEFREITLITTEKSSLTNMPDGAQIKDIPANTEISAIMKNRKFFIQINGREILKNLEGPVVIVSTGKIGVKNLVRKGNPAFYRGMIELRAAVPETRGTFNIINVLDFQTYLKGVVPNEMPVSFGLNALKAQAVAARNYATRPQNVYKNYDICDSTACQVYYGANSENPLSDRAVDETQGIFALYNKEPVLALYSSTAGGITEDYDYVYGSGSGFNTQKPYLKSVKDNNSLKIPSTEEELKEFYSTNVPSFDMKSPRHRWSVTFDRFELEDILTKTLKEQSARSLVYPAFKDTDEVRGLENIKVVKRGKSGKALDVEISAVSGKWRVKKELGIRRVFKKGNVILWSANFVVEKIPAKIQEEKTPETPENTLKNSQNPLEEGAQANLNSENTNKKAIFAFLNPENKDTATETAKIPDTKEDKKIYKNALGIALPEGFTFIGAGFGHGVGMSQYGAGYLSAQGVGYDSILKHYYSGITLGTMPKTVSYNNWNKNFIQKVYFDGANTLGEGVLPPAISKNPLKEEITALYNTSNAPARYILNIDNSKKPSTIEFYINDFHFKPDMKAFWGKILKMDITKYLKKGSNTIIFMPLKAADKEKTSAFWVEIEK